jgi:hypothetical protein
MERGTCGIKDGIASIISSHVPQFATNDSVGAGSYTRKCDW